MQQFGLSLESFFPPVPVDFKDFQRNIFACLWAWEVRGTQLTRSYDAAAGQGAGEEDEDDDDRTIRQMSKLLGLNKKDRVKKELAPSGLDYLLGYMEDAKKMREQGLTELGEVDDDRPEELSARDIASKMGRMYQAGAGGVC